MDKKTHLLLSIKLLEACGKGRNAIIYTNIPKIDDYPGHLRGIYAHSIGNIKKLVDNSISILTKKGKGNKNSYEYRRILEEKEKLFNELSNLNIKDYKISEDKIEITLSIIFHLYLDTFLKPIPFFLPHSSHCSGQWDFWNKIDYIKLKHKFNDNDIKIKFMKNILKNKIWNTKFNADDFPLIVKKRLLREGKLDKSLDPESMIKAIIIRMGELAIPNINYETIDFVIRDVFTYLQVDKYKRVDLEIEFLRRFEEEMVKEMEVLI